MLKGLSQQEQMEIYREYKQDLDKIEVDYKENIEKAQKLFMEQTYIQCGICITEMDCSDESKVTRLNCGHEFHTDCLRQALEYKNECPLCRRVCTLEPGT